MPVSIADTGPRGGIGLTAVSGVRAWRRDRLRLEQSSNPVPVSIADTGPRGGIGLRPSPAFAPGGATAFGSNKFEPHPVRLLSLHGRGGIRTHAGRCPHDFQSCALSHSATRPTFCRLNRGARIRTGDLCDPNAALYRTEPRPVKMSLLICLPAGLGDDEEVPSGGGGTRTPKCSTHAAFRVRCLTN